MTKREMRRGCLVLSPNLLSRFGSGLDLSSSSQRISRMFTWGSPQATRVFEGEGDSASRACCEGVTVICGDWVIHRWKWAHALQC